MITLTFIIIAIIAIYKSSSPDKKSKKQIEENNAAIAQLPDISFSAKEMSSMQKALNMWPGDKDLLQEFKYISSSQTIYMRMKDGRAVCCPLSQLDVTFDKLNGLYRIVIKNGAVKFSFYKFSYVFTNREWDVILDTLTLAGTTRNVEIMGTTYKNMTKANTVLKIIKAIN